MPQPLGLALTVGNNKRAARKYGARLFYLALNNVRLKQIKLKLVQSCCEQTSLLQLPLRFS